MSGVAIVRALLVGSANLIAQVPAARIIGGVLPQGTALPAVAITEVSAIEVPRIDAQSSYTIVDARVQVTVMAANYPAQKSLLALVRKACNYQRGTLAGVAVISVRRLSNGPDFSDPASEIHMQSMDFSVLYQELN